MADLPEQRNGGSRPVPDPTALTDVAIEKAVNAIRDYINGQLAVRDERLRGIDEATKLRLEHVDDIGEAIDVKIGRLHDVVNERFVSIGTQFQERDTRQEREARDNKVAVDAAFAASKEASTKQDESNQKSIDKSEKATAEKIEKLAELFATTTDGLVDKIDDMKERVGRIEAVKLGTTEGRSSLYALIGVIATIIFVSLAIAGIVVGTNPP